MKKSMTKPLSIALGTTFVAVMSASPVANADANPFGMQNLESGYLQVAEGKCGEGKCGEGKMKKDGAEKMKKEGKCGESHMKEKEGKCGEGMMKKEGDAKMKKEGKCGEGMMKKEGEGKCGGKK